MTQLSLIQTFLARVSAWATTDASIAAVALVGSYARGMAKDTSDIDLVILAEDPERFLADTAWVERFGQPLNRQVEDYGMVISLRVWYADGKEVEYGLTTPQWAALPLDEGTRQVIEDGMQVVFERAPLLSPLANPGKAA